MYPSHLFHGFKKENHAREFVDEGRCRLAWIGYYAKIEEKARRDATGGTSFWTSVLSGLQVQRMIGNNRVYLFCTAGPEVSVEYVREKWGKWVVRINDPSRLLDDLRGAAPMEKVKFWGKCELEKVSYTRGQLLNVHSDSMEAVNLNYLQKPPEESGDFEHRYVVWTLPSLEAQPPCYLHYELGRHLAYLELLKE